MEPWISAVLQAVDPFLIRLFFLTADPVVNFFIGSVMLAAGCVVVGEVTLSLAIRWNRQHIETLKQEIRRQESLSIRAREMGDHVSYQALNKAANDAWGRHFFTMAAYSAGVLWPVPFALGWMQIHFAEVNFLLAFPLSLVFGRTVGFVFSFIPIYILCRILFKYLHPWLPYFKGVHRMLHDDCTRVSDPVRHFCDPVPRYRQDRVSFSADNRFTGRGADSDICLRLGDRLAGGDPAEKGPAVKP